MIGAQDLRVERAAPGRDAVCSLRGVSLALEPGHLGLVLGRSGAGKTTLLEVLAGLVGVSAGAVTFSLPSGRWCWGPGEPAPPEARRRICLLFQYPERQLFGATALEDVAWGAGAEEAAERSLARVELRPELWRAPLRRLSRGEKRRVALAGVLAREPEALLLDEPAVGLDPEGQALLWREVEAYRRERGAAVLVATHWPEPLLGRAQDVLCLEAGAPVFAGPVAGLPEAARREPDIAGLLPFAWRLRLALEAGSSPPGAPQAWVDEARNWLGTRAWGSDQRGGAIPSSAA